MSILVSLTKVFGMLSIAESPDTGCISRTQGRTWIVCLKQKFNIMKEDINIYQYVPDWMPTDTESNSVVAAETMEGEYYG